MSTTPSASVRRTLFRDYAPIPLNDASVPPFPGRNAEADDHEDTARTGIDLDFERPQTQWAPIAAGPPPDDAPVRFVDGSIKSKTAGAIMVDGRLRPLIAATVSAAALVMEGRTLRRGDSGRTVRLLCVHSNGIDADALAEAKAALTELHIELKLSEAESATDFDTMRRTTRGIAMERMEAEETAVMLESPHTPTLMDGLLERRLRTHDQDVPIIGLVKRQMTTYLPDAQQAMVYRLKPGERTPGFVLETPQHVPIVNFYMRLSSQRGMAPSYGVVRVTAPLEYVVKRHRSDCEAYLSGLAGYLYALRCRDDGYSRAGISIEPIVRVEDHLHAILPDLESMIPRLHRLFPRYEAAGDSN